ncbi:MAG TPA: hypothetical protein VNI20_00720 [Fimbriimonadaceae bacterium]|nr:hypothetical protein [Fimbriimonadaceae bacterium]
MPKKNEDETPAEVTAQSENATPTGEEQKPETEAQPKRRTGLRKSEKSPSGSKKEKPRRRSAKRTDIETSETADTLPAPEIIAPEGAEDVLARLTWRPRQATPTAAHARTKTAEPARAKTELEEKPTETKKARTTRAKKETKPEPPKRKHIRIPEDAAQVVLQEGIPSISVRKRIVPPFALVVGISDEKTQETAIDEARMAAENGVRLFSLIVELIVDKDGPKAAADTLMSQVAALDDVIGDGYIVVRAFVTAPKNWDRNYKDSRARNRRADEPSMCDDEFWKDAETALAEFIKNVKSSKGSDKIVGVHIDHDGWFFKVGESYDPTPAAQRRFGQWLRHRYRDDVVSLRASWFDGKAEFDTVEVPQPTNGKSGEEFVRIGRHARRWVDYNLFLSDVTADRIAQLAYAAKSASEGWWLVGVNYGYTFEWSHPGSGHLSLGKILRCPDVDYVSGPSSYKGREPGGSAPFPCPIDSLSLNGKVFISEDDFKTPISGSASDPDPQNPVMKTPQALESAHWRSIGAALAHKSGVAWIDSWAGGWLTSRGIWERARKVEDAFSQRYAAHYGGTDVAVLVDERSLAYLVDTQAFAELVQNVRESVLRSGLSASFYLLSDLAHRENFPESRLYVFLNAWDVRPEVRSAIKTRLQCDNKVLFWLYSAGLFEAGRDALERVREVTGIALKPQPFHSRPGTTLLNLRHPLCASLPQDEMLEGGHLEPSYFAIPEDATVFGEYTHTGLASFVARDFTGDRENDTQWQSVFLGEPVVTPGLFRALGQMAGAHIWNFDNDVIHVRKPYLTIHCQGAGQRTITLPNNWSAYDPVTAEWIDIEGNSLRFTAIDGSTYVFYIGLRAEIEELLNADTDKLLTVESIEPRDENTVHWDSVQFDVQIMKLDEWVEENWSEQHADDLLLKPSMLDVDQEEEEEPPQPKSRGRRGGRGRRQHGRKGRRGSEETATARKEGADRTFDEAGIGVLFRKRQ